MKALLLALLSLLPQAAGATTPSRVELPSGALIVTHATRRFNTHGSVIQATRAEIDEATAQGRPVYALGDQDVRTDPRWYGYRDRRITRAWISTAGEHPFFPAATEGGTFEVEVIGGYHCACLGRTLVQLIERFLSESEDAELLVRLPMRAIYTGYRLSPTGALVPATPAEEAASDSSVDGENLETVTRSMDDTEWAAFMTESLRLSVLSRNPLDRTDLRRVSFRLSRRGTPVAWIPGVSPTRVIRFQYE